MKDLLLLIIMVFQLIFVSCSEEVSNLDADLRFDLRITNISGESQNTFNEGNTIVFVFEINNQTDEQIALLQFRNDDFFRLVSDDGTEVGFPYLNYFCDFRGALIISAGSTYTISVPWDAQIQDQNNPLITADICGVPGNNPLTAGSYTTRFEQMFSYTLNGDMSTTQEISFEQEFRVE